MELLLADLMANLLSDDFTRPHHDTSSDNSQLLYKLLNHGHDVITCGFRAALPSRGAPFPILVLSRDAKGGAPSR